MRKNLGVDPVRPALSLGSGVWSCPVLRCPPSLPAAVNGEAEGGFATEHFPARRGLPEVILLSLKLLRSFFQCLEKGIVLIRWWVILSACHGQRHFAKLLVRLVFRGGLSLSGGIM